MQPQPPQSSALSTDKLQELRSAAEDLFKSKQRDLTNVEAKRTLLRDLEAQQSELDSQMIELNKEFTAQEVAWEATKADRISRVQEAITLETEAISQIEAATARFRKCVEKASLPMQLHASCGITAINEAAAQKAPPETPTAELEKSIKKMAEEIETTEKNIAQLQSNELDSLNSKATAKLTECIQSFKEKLAACKIGDLSEYVRKLEGESPAIATECLSVKAEFDALEAEVGALSANTTLCPAFRERVNVISNDLLPLARQSLGISFAAAEADERLTQLKDDSASLHALEKEYEKNLREKRKCTESLREALCEKHAEMTQLDSGVEACNANNAIMAVDIAETESAIRAISAQLDRIRATKLAIAEAELPTKCASLESKRDEIIAEVATLEAKNSEIARAIEVMHEKKALVEGRSRAHDELTAELHKILSEPEAFYEDSARQIRVAELGEALLQLWDESAREQAKDCVAETSNDDSSNVTDDQVDSNIVYANRRKVLAAAVRCSRQFAEGMGYVVPTLEMPLTLSPRGAAIMNDARSMLDCIQNDAIAAEITAAQSAERCAVIRKEIGEDVDSE